MWTRILCDDPIEFLVSKSTPKNKKLNIPEVDSLRKSLDVYIEVNEPEEYVPCGDGALEEENDYEEHKEAGTICLEISHPMLDNGSEFVNVTVNFTVDVMEKFEIKKTLCFNGSLAYIRPKLISVSATSDMIHDMNIKVEVEPSQNSKCHKSEKENESSVSRIIFLIVIFATLLIPVLCSILYMLCVDCSILASRETKG